jgi:hypothetical protein
VLIINPALQLAHTRLLVEPFGHLLAQSAFLGHCLGLGFVFESQLDVLHRTAPGVPDFVSHPVGASCVHLPVFKVIAIVFIVGVLLVQPVLKWLQYLLCVKNVMPLHFVSSSHDFLHAARSETSPDDSLRKTSPAFMSHLLSCVRLVIAMASAFPLFLYFSHAVL